MNNFKNIKMYPKNFVIAILITTIIIDIMGLGLIFPVMPSLFYGSENVVFSELGGNFQSWCYSIALACWPLGLMIGCPIIGELSDKYGRKSILLLALATTFISYILSAYAIYSRNYYIFFSSRFIAGLAGGSFEIAQAAVIDISSEENKSRNIGLITMAGSLGFVIGPIITSLLANLDMDNTTSFLFAGFLAMINFIAILLFMKKDLAKNPGLVIKPVAFFKTILFLFSDKRVRAVGIVYFLVQCGWGFYGQGSALFLKQVYNYHVADIGLFYTVMGLATVVVSIAIQPFIFRKFSKSSAFIVATIICGLALSLVNIVNHENSQWFINIISSATQLICYTALLSIISLSVTDKEQGKAMGAAGAIFGLAWFVNDIIIPDLILISPGTPISFGGSLYFIAAIIFTIFITKKIFYKKNK